MNTSATRWEDVYKSQTARIAELERENAELRADKERLDWLEELYEWPIYLDGEWHCFAGTFQTFRAAIDAERREEG